MIFESKFDYTKTYYMIANTPYDKKTKYIRAGKHEVPLFKFPDEDTKTIRFINLADIGLYAHSLTFVHEVYIPVNTPVFTYKDNKTGIKCFKTHKAFVGRAIPIKKFIITVKDADINEYHEFINNILECQIRIPKRKDRQLVKFVIKTFPNIQSIPYEKLLDEIISQNNLSYLRLFIKSGIRMSTLNVFKLIYAKPFMWRYASKYFDMEEINNMQIFYAKKAISANRLDILKFMLKHHKHDHELLYKLIDDCISDDHAEVFKFLTMHCVMNQFSLTELFKKLIMSKDSDNNFDILVDMNYLRINLVVDILTQEWRTTDVDGYIKARFNENQQLKIYTLLDIAKGQ